MVFLAAIALLQMILLPLVLKGTSAHIGAMTRGGGHRFWHLPYVGVALAAGAPLFIEMMLVAQHQAGKPMSFDDGISNAQTALLAAGAVSGLLLFGRRLLALKRAPAGQAGPGAGIATPSVGFMACVYLAFVVVDHLTFFMGDKEAGVVNVGLLQQIQPGQIRDMQCDSEMMLVSKLASGTATSAARGLAWCWGGSARNH